MAAGRAEHTDSATRGTGMKTTFPSVTLEGGLFAPDLFEQLLSSAEDRSASFGLDSRMNLVEHISGVYMETRALWKRFQDRMENLPPEDAGTSLTSHPEHRACYECLLNFSNQSEAEQLNRHRIKEFLMHLSQTSVESVYDGRSPEDHIQNLYALTDSRSELERQFLKVLRDHDFRLPDEAQKKISDPRCVPDFFYRPNVCVFCDGNIHDQPEQRKRDEQIRNALKSAGYRVIVIRHDRNLLEQIRQYPEVFGPSDPRA